MKIESIEIGNFRKLSSTHIDFHEETTLLVGANNSGKTSMMVALRTFLVAPKTLALRDITIGSWAMIDRVGAAWESGGDPQGNLADTLPFLDVWLDVPISQIHKVVHILPTIDWAGGPLGVRLRYEVADLENLKASYVEARAKAKSLEAVARNDAPKPVGNPTCLTDYLENDLTRHVALRTYVLDPRAETRTSPTDKGVARPQALPEGAIPLPGNPFGELIVIHEISAQREFADAGTSAADGDPRPARFKRRLSEQVRSYYDRHLELSTDLSTDDSAAIGAMQEAERAFDRKLESGFSKALGELDDLGYPGIENPSIAFNTRLRGSDGLKHGSAVQYKVTTAVDQNDSDRHLPEDFAGLGYQNLISMVFLLMSFRDDWLASVTSLQGGSQSTEEGEIPPLHLVLVEEPEAHLHAQVQQVFIKRAYQLLRNHDRLRGHEALSTQLVVSTHSSHIAHEVDFAALRYFRRHQAESPGHSATTTVANLSTIFGPGNTTSQFVSRYLKSTHCDLFFADAAIFVEGQSERLLVPHFIRHHYPGLGRRYTSLVELGGAHAHRFKPLVQSLGLTTLVISDLDSVQPTTVTLSAGGTTTRNLKARPEIGKGQLTSNSVLKEWHPCLSELDALAQLDNTGHATRIEDNYDLYVAYQKPVPDPVGGNGAPKVFPRTFEDALIYANHAILDSLPESGTSKKVVAIVQDGLTGVELEQALFELIGSAEKAAFALDCLMELDKPETLHAPPYIAAGLSWLEQRLDASGADEMTVREAGNGQHN